MCYTIDEIREKIEDTAQKYQIQQIILFGSYAKGTATEESDIDFVVHYGENCRGLKCIEFQLGAGRCTGKRSRRSEYQASSSLFNKGHFKGRTYFI